MSTFFSKKIKNNKTIFDFNFTLIILNNTQTKYSNLPISFYTHFNSMQFTIFKFINDSFSAQKTHVFYYSYKNLETI